MGKYRQSKNTHLRGWRKVAKVPYSTWEGDRKAVVKKTFQLKAVVGDFHRYPSKYPKILSLSAQAVWIIKNFGKRRHKIIICIGAHLFLHGPTYLVVGGGLFFRVLGRFAY